MTTTLPDLASLTDEELAALCAGADEATINAVIAHVEAQDEARRSEKRQAAARAQAKARHEALKAEWWAQYVEPEHAAAQATCKFLLSRLGEREGIRETLRLWIGPEREARARASEELNLWWNDHPRTGFSAFLAKRAADARTYRDDMEREAMDDTDGESPAAVRRTAADIAARAERREAQHLAGLSPAQQAEVSQRRQGARSTQLATRDDDAPVRRERPQAPSCQPTDGVKGLTLLSEFHQRYDYWEHPEYADLLAAYDFQTHAREDDGSPIWRALPRVIVAGMHGTGKDGTMAQIAAACGTNVLTKVTYPGIRDAIGLDRETVILNEAQMTFGAGKKSEDVRIIINAHVKGNMIRDGKHGKMNVHGHVAMAGLPKLLTGKVSHEIADTLSRCFILWKVRKPKDYFVPEVTDAAEAQVRETIVPSMREWCMAYRPLLKGRAAWFGAGNPTGLPDLGGGGRGNDQLARPLLSVCDAATALAFEAWTEAGNDGADFPPEQNWAERIRKALIFVSGVPEPVDDEESPLDGVHWEQDRDDTSVTAASTDILAGLNIGGE